jgi:hypothetical protein
VGPRVVSALCDASPANRSRVWRSLASTIFQNLVAADDASDTFAALKRIHGLMPYFMLKTALRISNPVGMIRGACRARPSGAC